MSIYLDYFGLKQAPFAITPDPRYMYLSRRHEDALAHLLYGIGQGGSGGFVQLTGEVGTGKTTLCRCLLEQIPEHTRIALILNPMLKPRELLQAICAELQLAHGRSESSHELVNRLYAHLLEAHASGERVVLVIDEAQNMSRDSLEQVRLLTNLETHTDKLLQIILLGQPELRSLLARQELRQLAQRITARYHLQPLDQAETQAYVKHRLAVAGCARPLFNRSGYHALFQLSGGVPRLINILADRALLGAYASDSQVINAELIRQAGREVSGEYQTRPNRWSGARPWQLAALLLVLITAGYAGYLLWPEQSAPATATASATAPATPSEVGNSLNVPADSSAVAQAGPNNAVSALPDAGTADGAITAAVGAALPAAGRPALADWLSDAHTPDIWSHWAALWRLDQQRIISACAVDGADSPAATGVFCTRQPGSWSRIRQLNLPVLIELQNGASAVLVEGMRHDQVLLHNGHNSRWLEIAALRDLWNGSYVAVCPGSSETWRAGMQDPEIRRLKQLAAGLLEQPFQGRLTEDFDAGFAAWVAGFQARNGLRADRVLGQESKLFLCAASAGTPELLTSVAQAVELPANPALLAEGD